MALFSYLLWTHTLLWHFDTRFRKIYETLFLKSQLKVLFQPSNPCQRLKLLTIQPHLRDWLTSNQLFIMAQVTSENFFLTWIYILPWQLKIIFPVSQRDRLPGGTGHCSHLWALPTAFITSGILLNSTSRVLSFLHLLFIPFANGL